MGRLRKAAAAAPTLALGAAMAPTAAYAANGSVQSTLNDLTGSVSGILLALGYGGLTLVGGIAFVVLVKEIIPMFIEAGKPEFNRRIAVCIGVIALCIVAAFMPFIIDGFTAIAGTGVDLGTVAK